MNNQGEREQWQGRAERCIAQGCLTYSKSRRYYVQAQPSHVRSGEGKHLVGIDGHVIFDTVSGLGANLISCENSFSLPTIDEITTAEELLRKVSIPGYNRVKFVKTGSEADGAAARFMRGKTGRKGIYACGYSGWSGEYIGALPNCVGCPPTDVVHFNTHEELIQALGKPEAKDIAGVIMEPVMLDENCKENLQQIKSMCSYQGILLCYDEVITGFRFPSYTVAQTYGVYPDLLTMGKALGGGYPLGVVMGPAEILDTEGVFVSGTFAGETSALRAAQKVMSQVTPERLKMFWDMTHDFMKKLEYITAGRLVVQGYGTRIVFKDHDDGETYARYMQEVYIRHRILLGPVLFPKLSWTNHDYSLLVTAFESVTKDVDHVVLEGPKPRPVFRRNA